MIDPKRPLPSIRQVIYYRKMNDKRGIPDILSRRHWIFDLDGTLTLPVHDFAFIRAELRIPDGADILAYLDSLPEPEALPLRERLHEIEMELVCRTAASCGCLRLLSLLSSRGARSGILTRNSRATAVSTLSAIGASSFFEARFIIGRDEASPKPDPEGILKLASLWGVDPRETVVVGDFLFDLQTGRAAGAATVHVDAEGNFRWPDLADLMVESLDELSVHLEQTG
jgi:phosphoglycolate phosphatase-like HAD superfamily hydrolase